MKRLILFFLMLLLAYTTPAQEVMAFVIQGKAYIKYKVDNNEGIDAVASKFGITSASLIGINDLEAKSVLKENQEIKIPIAEIIKPACEGDACLKVYYEVQPHEGLYRIGKNYGDTKVAQLKQLNRLATESVAVGQKLLVGYLSMNAGEVKKLAGNTDPGHTPNKKTAEQGEPARSPIPDVLNSKAGTAPVPKNAIPDSSLLLKVEKSFFEDEYNKGAHDATMTAAVFKSESGWNDGKFYALINDLPTGTILKIENASNGLIIYAKVVGPLPEINKVNPVKIRISNAGASALSINSEDHFEVKVNY